MSFNIRLPSRGTGFTPCDPCGGLGFHRSGNFADRAFHRCPTCKGLGQAYLDPEPERAPLKLAPPSPTVRDLLAEHQKDIDEGRLIENYAFWDAGQREWISITKADLAARDPDRWSYWLTKP